MMNGTLVVFVFLIFSQNASAPLSTTSNVGNNSLNGAPSVRSSGPPSVSSSVSPTVRSFGTSSVRSSGTHSTPYTASIASSDSEPVGGHANIAHSDRGGHVNIAPVDMSGHVNIAPVDMGGHVNIAPPALKRSRIPQPKIDPKTGKPIPAQKKNGVPGFALQIGFYKLKALCELLTKNFTPNAFNGPQPTIRPRATHNEPVPLPPFQLTLKLDPAAYPEIKEKTKPGHIDKVKYECLMSMKESYNALRSSDKLPTSVRQQLHNRHSLAEIYITYHLITALRKEANDQYHALITLRYTKSCNKGKVTNLMAACVETVGAYDRMRAAYDRNVAGEMAKLSAQIMGRDQDWLRLPKINFSYFRNDLLPPKPPTTVARVAEVAIERFRTSDNLTLLEKMMLYNSVFSAHNAAAERTFKQKCLQYRPCADAIRDLGINQAELRKRFDNFRQLARRYLRTYDVENVLLCAFPLARCAVTIALKDLIAVMDADARNPITPRNLEIYRKKLEDVTDKIDAELMSDTYTEQDPSEDSASELDYKNDVNSPSETSEIMTFCGEWTPRVTSPAFNSEDSFTLNEELECATHALSVDLDLFSMDGKE